MRSRTDVPATVISDCSKYRYFLSRTWRLSRPVVAFIGLNPSTADATADDPTIRRCVNFAKTWGAGSLWMANLFGLRSPIPSALVSASDPVGPENDAWLQWTVTHADIVVAAWGNQGRLLDRASIVSRRFRGKLQCLTKTKAGMPGHPLYIRGGTMLRPFEDELA